MAKSVKLKNDTYIDSSGIDHYKEHSNEHFKLDGFLTQAIPIHQYASKGEAGWYKVAHIPPTDKWGRLNIMFSIMPTIWCYGAGGIFTVSSYNITDIYVRVLAGSLAFGNFKVIKESDSSMSVYYKTTDSYTGVQINCLNSSHPNWDIWDGCGYVGTSEPSGTSITIKDESVQSGSNSNGSYTKYADGTLICRCTKTIEITTPNTIGALYYGYVANVGDFPHAFISKPEITYTHFDGADCICLQPYSVAHSNCMNTTRAGGVYPICANKHTEAYTITISYIAVGRWK